jgi:glutaredoxin
MEYLEQQGIAYDKIDVRGSPERMMELGKVSGQNLTPTLVWDGKVLANFDVDRLEQFLAEQHVGAR